MRSSDFQLLEDFIKCLSFLKLNTRIAQSYTNGYAKKSSYRVQFSRVQFYRWLLKIGLFPRKTYTIGELRIPDKLFRDFLRGHLDGDGSILAYTDRYNVYRGRSYVNQRIFTRFISASQKHLIWLRGQVKKLVELNGALICNKPLAENRVPMWELKFAKAESLKLLQWIYYKPGLPCLERKRKCAFQTINTITSTKRKTYTRIHTQIAV